MVNYYKKHTAQAPVNIAIVKYWGKCNESLKIPVNDSISGTLDTDKMSATTSVEISSDYDKSELWLNGERQNFSPESNAHILLQGIKNLSKLDKDILECNVRIVSNNNFPTAAGLASSAAGYACLAFVLGHAYGVTDSTELSKIARRGSGSACRSLFGGFVQWVKGEDHASSKAVQIVDHEHWPEMRVVICVCNDQKKDVSSSYGMQKSVDTSQLLSHRAKVTVPTRIEIMKSAILNRDFQTFADETMQDSNQFHAICLDTFPPLFYMNDASREIIRLCTAINSIYGRNRVAYTFDAGPNACIYLLEDFVDQFLALVQHFFPLAEGGERELEVRGNQKSQIDRIELQNILEKLSSMAVRKQPGAINYLISTTIGKGPRLIE